jgi:hypothetical protein
MIHSLHGETVARTELSRLDGHAWANIVTSKIAADVEPRLDAHSRGRTLRRAVCVTELHPSNRMRLQPLVECLNGTS